MISDEAELKALLEEIAEWPLQKRREYIAAIEATFGKESANQIRRGLTALWQSK
jgi:hypothetical protein